MEHQDGSFQSNLKEQEGVSQPPVVNPNIHRFMVRKKELTLNDYLDGILKGDRTILSRAITLVESSKSEHQALAQEIVNNCLPHSGKSLRIGITGVPGVGKSTFIESFGKLVTSKGHKLAVLAIDPSSEKTKGSILGDKTRMEELACDPLAYIRPSPSAGSLGGVARKTRETVVLCEAAGFDIVFIETVGVGQSETAVHSMVDFFLLLMLAGAGDELQGIKRGIMEMADALVITKSDGDNEIKAQRAKVEYQGALHLFPATPSGWVPQVLTCSALTKTGLPEVFECAIDFKKNAIETDHFIKKRNHQALYWMYQTIDDRLKNNFYSNNIVNSELVEVIKNVKNGKVSSFSAANYLFDKYISQYR